MSPFLQRYGIWLADYYLLSTVLLVGALVFLALVAQPARRMSVIKSSIVALLFLAVLCAIPRFSVVHLSAAQRTVVAENQIQPAATTVATTIVVGEAEEVVTPANRDRTALSTRTNITSAERVSAQWSWTEILPLFYMVGSIASVGWLFMGWLASRRLLQTARQAPPSVINTLRSLPELDVEASRVRIMTHDRIQVAAAVGIWRPTILLPASWLESQSPRQLLTALAHEVRHVANRDLAWVSAIRVLMLVLWANPLFWMMKRRLRLDQELLADAAAAEIIGRRQYAEQLVTWARNVGSRPAYRVSAAVGLWESPSQLRRRISLLLNDRITIGRSCPHSWKFATAAALTLAAFLLSVVTFQPRAAAKAEPTTKTDAAAENLVSTTDQPAKAISAIDKPTPNTVAGQALSDKKEPLAGAEVFLFRYDLRDSSRKLIGQTKTNDDGRFQFGHVIKKAEFPKNYVPPTAVISDQFVQCIVRHPGLVPFEWRNTPAQVALQGMYRTAQMSPANTLTGRITDSDGVPIAGALVTVGDSYGNWNGIQSTRTDADGNYKIEDLAPIDAEATRKQIEEAQASTNGAFFPDTPEILTVASPNFATKQVSLMKVPGKQDIQLDAPAIIEGRVVFDEPKPVAREVIVRAAGAITADTPKDYSTGQLLSPIATARANQDGTYRFANLPPGTYAVSAQASDWVHRDIPSMPAVAGSVTKLPLIVFTKGGFISVRPIDAKTRKPIPIEPHMTALLMAHSNEPWFETDNHAVEANADGRFVLQVPAGKQDILVGAVRLGNFSLGWTGSERPEVTVLEGQTVEVDVPVEKFEQPSAKVPGTLAVNQTEIAKDDEKASSETSKRTPTILSYGDGKPDGKKSYGGSGFMIEFEMPEGVTKIKGLRIHGSRYGLPQAPNEDFEITFLSEKRDEVLHTESAHYKFFKRGKENWVRIPFKEEIELPKRFWVALDFNAEQTKGVYVSYDTSTKGEHSRVGLAGDDKEPKAVDFGGDWMVQVLLGGSR